MNILLLICARGGSKGVKNKNIRILAGKPLIAYTILQALRFGKAKRIICSTDSPVIAQVAREFGAETPFIRPSELAQDASGKVEVIKHALLECERIYNEKYDLVVDLDATSPIRKMEDIRGCIETSLKTQADVVFSVVPAHRNPYFNMVERASNGKVIFSKNAGKILRRQDAPIVYDMNASIYIYTSSFLKKHDKPSLFVADKLEFFVMEPTSALDIDSELDFQVIDCLIKKGVIVL